MKKIFEAIKDNPLWSSIGYSDFEKMYNCIEGRTEIYKKGDIVLLSGDTVNFIGIICQAA